MNFVGSTDSMPVLSPLLTYSYCSNSAVISERIPVE